LAADDDSDEDNDRMVLLAASIRYKASICYTVVYNVTIWDYYEPWVVYKGLGKQHMETLNYY